MTGVVQYLPKPRGCEQTCNVSNTSRGPLSARVANNIAYLFGLFGARPLYYAPWLGSDTLHGELGGWGGTRSLTWKDFFFLNNRAICHTLYIFAVFAGDIKTDFYGAFFFLARGMFCGWCNEENSALTSARPAILGQRVSLVGCSVVGRLVLGLMPSLS